MLYSAPRCLTVCLAPAAAAAAVATIAMVMINLLPRRELAEIGENWEEGSEVRAGWVCVCVGPWVGRPAAPWHPVRLA